jgi:hypothetical protein
MTYAFSLTRTDQRPESRASNETSLVWLRTGCNESRFFRQKIHVGFRATTTQPNCRTQSECARARALRRCRKIKGWDTAHATAAPLAPAAACAASAPMVIGATNATRKVAVVARTVRATGWSSYHGNRCEPASAVMTPEAIDIGSHASRPSSRGGSSRIRLDTSGNRAEMVITHVS